MTTCSSSATDTIMRMPALIAFLLGLAAVFSSAHAQEFRIEEVAAVGALPIAQLKPKTIAFADQPPEELVDASTGFMRFEDWARAQPTQKQFQSLSQLWRAERRCRGGWGQEALPREAPHVCGASPLCAGAGAGSLDLARVAKLPFVEQIDPAIKHRLITAGDVAGQKDPEGPP